MTELWKYLSKAVIGVATCCGLSLTTYGQVLPGPILNASSAFLYPIGTKLEVKSALLPVLRSIPGQSTATVSLDCVTAEATPLSPDAPDYATSLDLNLYNGCGKDITAVGVEIHSNGGPSWTLSYDWTLALAQTEPNPNADILRHGASVHYTIARNAPPADDPVSASLTFVIYVDCTAVGSQRAISSILKMRRDTLSDFEQQGMALEAMKDRSQANSYLAENHPALPPLSRQLLAELQQKLTKLTPSDWDNYIQDRQRHVQTVISLFTTHSQVVMATTGEPPEVTK
jgi:hypothetical protein